MMNRRLNIKLLAYLIGGSTLFMVAIYFLHEFQVDRNAEGLLIRANAAREAGDLDETVRLLSRYLEHREDDSKQAKQIALDAKTNLFNKLKQRKPASQKDFQTAKYLMDQAVLQNVTDAELRREAVDFWFQFGVFKEAIKYLEEIEDLAKDPPAEMTQKVEWTTDDELRYIEALRMTKDPAHEEKAIQRLETMLGYDRSEDIFITERAEHPEMLEAYQSLVLLLMQRLDTNLAEKTIDQLLRANPDAYKAHLIYASMIRYILRGEGKEKSYAAIRKAYAMAPQEVDALQSMASMYLELNQPEEAKHLIEEGLTKADSMRSKSRLYSLLAQVYITSKDMEGALKVLDRGNAEVPLDRDLLWTKARLLLDEQRFEDVEALYKPLEKAAVEAPMIAYLQARILLAKGEHREATVRLAKIREVVNEALQYEIDVYLSIGYAATRQHDLRLATIKRLLAVRPDDTQSHEQYAQVLYALGRNQEALDYIDQVLVPKLENGAVPESVKVLRTTLSMQTQLGEATEGLAAQDLKTIQDSIRDILNDPDIPDQTKQAILVDYFRKVNDPAKAKNAIDTLLAKDPTAFAFWNLRINYAETQAEANQILERMESSVDPKYKPAILTIKASLAARFAPDTLDDTIQSLQAGLNEFEPEQQAGVLLEFGKLQLMRNNRDEGIRLIELAAAKAPQNLSIVSTLYEDAKQQSDADRINQMVDRIKSITGTDDDTWRLAEAGRIVWMIGNGLIPESQQPARLNRARQLMRDVKSNRPEHLPVILLESDIQRIGGEPRQAIATLERAHSLQPGNANLIRLIAQSYRDLGDLPAVERWMKKLPLLMRSDRDKRIALSNMWKRNNSWSSEDAQTAVDLVNEIVPDSSQVAVDWILKSQVYAFLKQYPQAEQAANRARELEPTNPEVWTNVLGILMSQNKTAEVQELLQAVQTELPETERPSVLGRCYSVLKDYDAAQAQFAIALRADPSNNQIKRLAAQNYMAQQKTNEAVNLIQQILQQNDPEKDEAEVAWARRSMARIYSGQETYAAFKKALEEIEKNAVDGKLGPQDLALWVLLCYVRPEKSSWDQALIRLEQVEKDRPLTDDELFMKAQIYEKYGDEARWEEAKSLTVDLLARNPGNARIIETYVKWLLKRGQLQEAKQYATNNLNQGSVTRVLVELHSNASEGRIQQAVKKIRQLTPQNPTTARELSSILTLAAMTEELGQYHDGFYQMAEELFKVVAQKVPSQVLRLATTMGLHGDTKKIQAALQICRSADQLPELERASAALAILREHPDKWENELADAVTAIGQWLDQMAASKPEDLSLQWKLAEYHDMLGNLDRTETEYTKILNSPDFNHPIERGMVLNNLAYVMALNGKSEKPLQLIAEAEVLLGPIADLIDTRGYIYFASGNASKAASDFQEAISIGPETSEKVFHLALALDKLGKTEQAAAEWAKADKLGLNRYDLPRALHDAYDRLKVSYEGTAAPQS